MKCLLCSSKFQDQHKLIDHYLTYHNVNQNNWFLTTKKEKAKHDFIKRYDAGKEIPFEEKTLDVIQLPALTIYKIEFKKYSKQYYYYDSEKCINDFLRNVKYRFQATNKKWFKCSFTIENTQNSIRPDLQALTILNYRNIR